jgi:transcriptional regulator with XRE-family HTH domain
MTEINQRIKALRANAGISQQKLAAMLGVSRPTVTQIEAGDRKVSSADLIKLSEIFNISVDQLICLQDEPEVVLQNNNPGKKTVQGMRINVPQKNLDKFKEILIYILNKIGSKPNIGETVIYKLLYFIDFDFYEKYEEQLIGATYVKNHYGPTPLEFKKVVAKMIADNDIVKVRNNYFDYPQTKYLPLRKAILSGLKAHEVELIDGVLNRLSDMNANQISEYSHNDVPWLTTGSGEIIEYESVFYRTPLYSVREYS